jgi:hypothetical protein
MMGDKSRHPLKAKSPHFPRAIQRVKIRSDQRVRVSDVMQERRCDQRRSLPTECWGDDLGQRGYPLHVAPATSEWTHESAAVS